MKKLLLAISLFITGGALAQSNTYKIETLSKPEKLMTAVASNQLYKNIEKDFVKLSVKDNLVDLGQHSVIAGYLSAYQNHYPITISPDIAWLLICQGFANHVNNSPEEIRAKIVSFEGKETLTVIRDQSQASSLETFPWESVFPEFASQIAGYSGESLVKTLSADFSTTTPTTSIASQITIMESVREFFNYKVILMGCGIPEVTVEGTVKDWEKIYSRLDQLEKYDLAWWTDELKPVIKKIIATKKGKLDKQFWMNMVKYHKLGVYGSYDGIDGWLLKFYPYLTGGSDPMLAQAKVTKDGFINFPISNSQSPEYKTRRLYMRRSEFKEIKNVSDLPKEIVSVPFEFIIQDGVGKTIQTLNMEFWAGFMGVKQDKSTFNVKPEIGWAVNQK
jgi:hypothetical protein